MSRFVSASPRAAVSRARAEGRSRTGAQWRSSSRAPRRMRCKSASYAPDTIPGPGAERLPPAAAPAGGIGGARRLPAEEGAPPGLSFGLGLRRGRRRALVARSHPHRLPRRALGGVGTVVAPVGFVVAPAALGGHGLVLHVPVATGVASPLDIAIAVEVAVAVVAVTIGIASAVDVAVLVHVAVAVDDVDVAPRPSRVEDETEDEADREGDGADYRRDVCDDPADPDVARPVGDVVTRLVRARLRRDQNPAAENGRRDEAEQEDARRDPRQAPLRPAAEQLRKGDHEGRSRDQAHREPVVAHRVARPEPARKPDQGAGYDDSDQGHQPSCQSIHGITSLGMPGKRSSEAARYASSWSRRTSNRADSSS